MKKGLREFARIIFTVGLTITMCVSMLNVMRPVYAAKTSTKTITLGDEDYADTFGDKGKKSQNDVDALKNVTIPKNLKDFNISPIYDINNNQLILPVSTDYTIEVFGSDNKPTIGLSGDVTRPLRTQTVKLLYKLTNKTTATVTTTEKNAEITIPGKELNVSNVNKKPEIIPGLREWAGGTGSIDLSDAARIVVVDTRFGEAAQSFKTDYQDLTGRNIEIIIGSKTDVQAGDIFFNVVDDTMLGNEGYYLNIGGDDAAGDYVEIKATHNTGAVYGGVTILQILKQDSGRNDLPRGLIKDYPLFEQRGMMFDVARKFIPMSYLKDLTKQMNWYKLNMLSVHLSDNDIWNSLTVKEGNNTEPEGWFRLECETFPGLTSANHYTKTEFKDFQKSAMSLGVDVIPELDTPGHALAYTSTWANTARSDNKKYLDVTNPKVLENTKKLFDEYIDEGIFAGPNVNIGTDEYKTKGLSESDSTKYKEAFRKYCNDLLVYIRSKGKNPVFWGSLTENSGNTEVTTDATMFAWYQGYANAKQSLDAGYKIISMEDLETYIVPGGGWYSNQFGQAEKLYNNWLPNNNDGWANNPAPVGHPGVSGGQFAVWNDFVGNGISVHDISYRIQHNLYTVAEKCWAGTQTKSDGRTYDQEKTLAKKLGDAPNVDFLYEIDKSVKNNELLMMDSQIKNNASGGVALTKSSNVTETVAGKQGKALKFNGGSSYIQTDIKSPGFGWSTAMWIRPDQDNPSNVVLMEGKTGTLRLNQGQIEYDVENYTHTFQCDIENDQWTHVALVGNYEGVKLYINGEFFDSLDGKAFPNWNKDSDCDSWEGKYPTNEAGVKTQRYFETLMLPMSTIGSQKNALKGTIDDLSIYNKELSSNEIAGLVGEADVPKVEHENDLVKLKKESENDIIKNGNFDNNGENWTANTNAEFGNSDSAAYDKDGYYAYLKPDNGNAVIHQTLHLKENTKYTAKAMVKLSTKDQIVLFNVKKPDLGGGALGGTEVQIRGTQDNYEKYQEVTLEIDTSQLGMLDVELCFMKYTETTDKNDPTYVGRAYIDNVTLFEHTSGEENQEQYHFVWTDDFNKGALDTDKWDYELGHIRGIEQQHYVRDDKNVYVKDGHLNIVATNRATESQYTVKGLDGDGKPAERKVIYDSGSIRTHDSQEFLYGRIEMKAKLPKGQGVFPAFWTLGSDFTLDGGIDKSQGYGWPRCGEVDIMELVGDGNLNSNANKTVYQTLHYGVNGNDAPNSSAGNGTAYVIPESDDGYHIFGLNWSKNKMEWYVDDKIVRTVDYSDDLIAMKALNKPQYVQLNLAMGGTWPGEAGTDLAGTIYDVDYVYYAQSEQQRADAKEYYSYAPSVEGAHDKVMVQGETPDLVKDIKTDKGYHVEYSIDNDPSFQNNAGNSKVNLVTSSSKGKEDLAKLSSGEYTLYYTAIKNGASDGHNEPDNNSTYLFDRETVRLTVEAPTLSDENLSAVYGEKLSSVALPDHWTWDNGDVILNASGTTYAATYRLNDVVVKENVKVRLVAADKTELNELINQAEDYLNEEIYTAETLDILKTKIADAQSIAKKENATNNDVKTAYDALNSAIQGLAKKPSKPSSDNEYTMITGEESVIVQGQKLTFTSNAAYEKFKEVQLDGKILDKSYYTVQSGSTIVTLSDKLTKQLSIGKHTITIVSEDGSASTTFTIKAVQGGTDLPQTNPIDPTDPTKPSQPGGAPNNPLTEDQNQIGLWTIAIVAMGTVIFGLNKKRKQEK